MNKYEITFVVKPDMEEAEIKKYKTGYYYFLAVTANKEAIEEFKRVVKINESVIRHLVIRVED